MACQLRVAFARDPDYRTFQRPSTYSSLGTAAHAVTEAAFLQKGWPSDPTTLRSQLEDLWEREIEQSAGALAKAWAPAEPPPPPEWPGYALTRARIIRRSMKLLSTVRVAGPESSNLRGVEVELRDPDSGMFGRADRIESDGESTRIVDLKTGLNQDIPTEDQERQLHLYAVLVHRRTGSWPRSIAIEDASGSQSVLPLDQSRAEETVREVGLAVDSFNSAVETDGVLAMADPSPDHCRWCPYRVICQPFWQALSSGWNQRSALGAATVMGTSDHGYFVELELESPIESVGHNLRVSGLSEPVEPSATKVAITDWAGSPERGTVHARWSTIIRTW